MARLHIMPALDIAHEIGRPKRRLARRGHPLADAAFGETACEGNACAWRTWPGSTRVNPISPRSVGVTVI
jgi:hypothetical protein